MADVCLCCILVPELWETTTLGLMLNQLQVRA